MLAPEVNEWKAAFVLQNPGPLCKCKTVRQYDIYTRLDRMLDVRPAIAGLYLRFELRGEYFVLNLSHPFVRLLGQSESQNLPFH